MLVDELSEMRVLVHLSYKGGKKLGGQVDELHSGTPQATVGIWALRPLHTSFADVTRSALEVVSLPDIPNGG